MTKTKRTRNTRELPISTAIESLATLYVLELHEANEAQRKAAAKVAERFDARAEAILSRVPEDIREHVIGKAKARIENLSAEVQRREAYMAPEMRQLKPVETGPLPNLQEALAEVPSPAFAPDPTPIPARLLEPLSEERLAVIGKKR